tara:strand:+ start:2316 stop:2729 length:414 start_codon:yes stop_codon:yes gene_type:complete
MEVIIAFLITIMFFLSGIDKIKKFSGVTKSIQKKFIISTLPIWFYQLSLIFVILLEIFAPLIIIYSSVTYSLESLALYSCYALVVFTILATIMYHPPNKKKEYHYFMKNLSIVGGLLALAELYKPLDSESYYRMLLN